jgi:Rod binding domain-containing protein
MNVAIAHSMGTAATSGAASALGDSPDVKKLKKAASDFEAMLLAKWWSSMKESGFGGDDDQSDPGHDTLDSMGIQAMSTAVASRGGLGIGAMLVRSLLSNAQGTDAAANPPAPAKQQE